MTLRVFPLKKTKARLCDELFFFPPLVVKKFKIVRT